MKETIHFSDLEPKPIPDFLAAYEIPEAGALFTFCGATLDDHYFHDHLAMDYIIGHKPKALFVWQFGDMVHAGCSNNVKKFFKHLPDSRIIHCCNSEEYLNDIPTEYGDRVSGIVCNHNATLDRNEFFIIPRSSSGTPLGLRTFDCIYNARICRQKRLHLTYNLDNIIFLTGQSNKTPKADAGHNRNPQVIKGFNDSYEKLVSNFRNKDFCIIHKNLSIPKVNRTINDAKVGLCLSKREGAMWSSVEYLLCGLPIVSTKSTGGRDAFFTDKNCIIAEDTPESVFECVQHWLDNYPTRKRREKIREEAIATQKKHTKALKDKLKEISPSNVDIDAVYKQRYQHKMHYGTNLRFKGVFN